ncbi:MAG: hypothetical protein QOD31_3661 [Pseudonocardiales bacterium]|jgi:hypothetical protein|nr:hypothetical protein [Pseudonocardiales bacterium]
MPVSLVEKQRISTSGARAVAPFTVGGHQLLAIAQLALDIPGQEPSMNGGDSDTSLLLLQRTKGRYVPWSTLPAPGGEDAEFFTIRGRSFLAVASIRSGRGPYDFTTDSAIFEWDGTGFVLFQSVQTFAAKQWKHWQIGERHFLGLAQGVRRPDLATQNRDSFVYEWDGSSFVEFQRIKSQWAYNWHPFFIGEQFFVAHAEHLDASLLYRWDGERLCPHQTLAARGGRSFAAFDRDGASYLVVASLLEPPRLMRWNGERFTDIQVLDGLGARELAVVRRGDDLLVIRINFILGTPADPHPVLDSQIYEWRDGSLHLAAQFPTSGGTDVAVLDYDGDLEILVSNSLSAQLRFANDTVLYSLSTTPSAGQ